MPVPGRRVTLSGAGSTGTPRFVLASASPARLALLRAAGLDPEVVVSGVDESGMTADDPEKLSLHLARLKADAVAERLRSAASSAGDCLVLGCDSLLAFAGQVWGKPPDAATAAARWRRMRGHSGVLHTGHSLIDIAGGTRAEAVGSTIVYFGDLADAEIAAYVDSGEPLRVAGAFTIDGLGGPFIERIDGDHGNVVGVSLPVLRGLLAELGYGINVLWRTSPGADG